VSGVRERWRRRRGQAAAPEAVLPSADELAVVQAGVPDLLGEQGWATVRLVDVGTCADLRATWDELQLDPEHDFYATSAHADRATARRIDQLVKATLGPPLAEVLPGWEPFLGAFISKGPLGWNAVELHQDWTYTREPGVRAVVVWCPLADTDPSTGGLHVVPGSHRWSTKHRGSGEVPGPLADVGKALADSGAARPVELAAGEAVLYDAALLHGSPPNAGDDVRVAAAIALAPTGAELVHLHAEAGGPVQGYVIDEGYYTLQPYAAAPEGAAAFVPDPTDLGVLDPDAVPALLRAAAAG
jgi:hypothetical protein